ncbi:transposase [Treponema sp.]|uniref:transposase n=1 Tax=Treponema sp. TaxID=166 RepID=UPI00388E8166
MSRKPRVYGTSGFYHVILRGNNKQNLFNDVEDRKFFLEKLKKYSNELGIKVYAFCLMNNHVHVLIGNANENMSLMVQKIANSYVYYFNRKYERSGHLFQGRFKSEPVLDDEYFKTVYRYILQNSEKAGLETFDRYRWNSFYALKNTRRRSFVDTEYVITLFGSRKKLMNFVYQRETINCMEYENMLVFTDCRVLELIKKLFGISSPYKLERLPIDEQKEKCSVLKKLGISMSQIARITGISRKIIRMS